MLRISFSDFIWVLSRIKYGDNNNYIFIKMAKKATLALLLRIF